MYILIGVNDPKNHVYICMTGILKILAPLTIDSPKILFMTEFSLQISVCVQGLTLDFLDLKLVQVIIQFRHLKVKSLF